MHYLRRYLRRVKEHLWLFSHRKEACPEICLKRHKCSSSDSALWRHSREAHGGTLRVEDWRVTLTSTHRGALNRQVTEAVKISNEGLGSLLNSKHEFGSNNLSELAVRKGNVMVGGEIKRKRQEEEKKEEDKKEEAVEVVERKVKVPTKSMVKREVKEVEEVKEVKEETTEEMEEELIEGFKKLKMTNTIYVILVKNEGNTVEVSPVK